MSKLNQESKVENITLSGVVEGANVRITYSRENGDLTKINANVEKQTVSGMLQHVLYVDWQPISRHVTIAASNCSLDDVPLGLVEKVIAEMQLVHNS